LACNEKSGFSSIASTVSGRSFTAGESDWDSSGSDFSSDGFTTFAVPMELCVVSKSSFTAGEADQDSSGFTTFAIPKELCVVSNSSLYSSRLPDGLCSGLLGNAMPTAGDSVVEVGLRSSSWLSARAESSCPAF